MTGLTASTIALGAAFAAASFLISKWGEDVRKDAEKDAKTARTRAEVDKAAQKSIRGTRIKFAGRGE